jgi:hypothetical protein
MRLKWQAPGSGTARVVTISSADSAFLQLARQKEPLQLAQVNDGRSGEGIWLRSQCLRSRSPIAQSVLTSWLITAVPAGI